MRRIKKPMCRALQILLFTVLTGSILAQHRPTLEPHVLAGKRLVFTNWYFVRPPFFDWVNDKGESVYISATENYGLYGAEFVTRDVSFGVKFFVEECKPELPLFKNDKPWDKWGIRLFNLIYYNGKYRMWGRCYTDNLSGRPCYFESLDGIHWEKPNLGLVEFEGNPLEGHSFEDCDPIIGNQYQKSVTWKGNRDLGVDIGTPVYFRFKMKFAKLYCLDFE